MPTHSEIEATLKRIGLVLTTEQEPIVYSPQREILVSCGERSGKSKISAGFLTTRLPYGNLYWLVAADYERTRAEFEYTCEYLDRLGLAFEASHRVDPGEINIVGGIKIETKSAKDPRRLAAFAPDGIVICEASQVDYETYLRVRSRLAEKRGWLLMAGTFEASLGWYPEAFQRGQAPTKDENDLVSFALPSWSNTFVYPLGRNDPEILRLETTMPHDFFLERFAGIPCPPQGRVFDDFAMKIHAGTGKDFDFKTDDVVYIFVDPGYASAYSVLAAQKRGDHLYIIDEVFERGLVTSEIIKVTKQKPWWNKIVGGAIDIAATQHQAMPAPTEIWLREAGIHLKSQKVQIRDGIEAVKRMLVVNPKTGQPLLHVNARCSGLISEFGGCPNPITSQTAVYSWRKDKDGNVIGDIPEDKHNHAVKVLSYGIVDLFGYSMEANAKPKIRFF